MTIHLAPEDETLVAEIIETSGVAGSAEVIHQALIAPGDSLRLEHLRELVDESDADVARGNVVEWTPALMGEIRAGAQEMIRMGQPIDPDARP